MEPETEGHLRLEIGHVLFIDLVGYSKLLTEEQNEQLRQLTDIVLATGQVVRSTNEKLVRLPTGDGMALVFRNTSEEPAQCALEIAQALKEHPEIKVRMGVHSGPVNEVTDLNGRTNIAGAGINLAQRVMDCGDAGHILLSKRVADDLEEYRNWRPYLHDLGECEVKHGVKVSIVNLFTDQAGNPEPPRKISRQPVQRRGKSAPLKGRNFFAELRRRNVYRAGVIYAMAAWLLIQVATQVFPFFEIPNWIVRLIIVLLVIGFPIALALAWAFEITPEGIVKTEDAPPEKSARWQAGRKLDFVIIGILAVAIGFLLFLRFSPSHQAKRGADIPEKSIAVLPFENLSDDKENAFFADGIQDDLLTNLAKIKALTVISRTSVMKYRDVSARDIKEIGKSLGVANILEGSVRRENDRVVVNVQLVDAFRDRNIWANRYERSLADSLGLEGQLATEISAALRTQLTPDEKVRVARRPTQNAEAYVLYLRALPYEQGPDKLLEDYRQAVELYSKAIALDPDFALARAHLASTCAEIFHFQEPLDSWKDRARSEAEAALRLQPDLGEAHFALGQCAYWFDNDYARALSEFSIAQNLLPNDSNIGAYVAAIRRRQGRWEEALATYERMEKLDPQNANVIRNILFTNTSMRRWPQAAQAAARFRAVAPDSVVAKIQTGYVEFWWKGDVGAVSHWVADIPSQDDPDGVVTSARWEGAMLKRDFSRAADILAKSSTAEFSYLLGGLQPKSYLLGITALPRNDRAAAAKYFAAGGPEFEKAVQEAADAAERHANLGLLYAFMDRRDDAIREGRLAVELKPLSKDATDGALMLCYLALIYARVGQIDQAIPLIEQLLKTSGAVDSVDYSITLNDLKYRWEWDPLRKDPRFQKLLEQNTPPK
jgi:TolB-like protein